MDERASTRLARDRLAMLAESMHVYNDIHVYSDPSRAHLFSAAKRQQKLEPTKMNRSTDLTEFPFPIQPFQAPLPIRGYRVAQAAPKRSRLHLPVMPVQDQKDQQAHLCLRGSTCSVLQASISTPDPDFWILPDFEDWEDWELETDGSASAQHESSWGEKRSVPLLERAVRSNQERLKRRLEGDGWDFVGGKHGEDGKLSNSVAEARAQESVDEEFDFVVLPPMVQAV